MTPTMRVKGAPNLAKSVKLYPPGFHTIRLVWYPVYNDVAKEKGRGVGVE